MRRNILLIMILFSLTFNGCTNSALKEDGIYAVIKTNMGDIICKLFYDKTPITVGNFVGLAEGTKEFTDPQTKQPVKRPFYKGLIFHRIIKGFMIQGGCPYGTGYGDPGYKFVDEFDPALLHDSAGILSMANSGPNTNGSQFFITLVPTPHLNGRHAVFGKVVSGLENLMKIGDAKTDNRDKPFQDVVIKEIVIERVGEAAKNFNAGAAFAKNDEVIKLQEQEKAELEKKFLKQLGVDETKIVTTDSGLRYFVRKDGTGKKPAKGDTIVAHYAGYLVDGKKFDSSYDRNRPFETEIGIGRVIAGWDEAFMAMKEGEKRVLIIPDKLGYGERGSPPVIPPKSTIIFDVELIKVKK